MRQKALKLYNMLFPPFRSYERLDVEVLNDIERFLISEFETPPPMPHTIDECKFMLEQYANDRLKKTT